MTPPSTCISWNSLPSTSTSIMTGETAPGMLIEATMMLRNSSSAPGAWLAAIVPMFQVTGRAQSRSVVPIIRIRPLAYSAAICASTSGVMYFAMSRASGLLSATPSLASRVRTLRDRKMSFGPTALQICWMTASYCGPRNANGATRAPALMPVTILNTGRVPCRVHPAMSPAAKVPASPPPEMASMLASGRMVSGLPVAMSASCSLLLDAMAS
ncbi:hypothetical protein D3C87_1406180 [compost metagenome]